MHLSVPRYAGLRQSHCNLSMPFKVSIFRSAGWGRMRQIPITKQSVTHRPEIYTTFSATRGRLDSGGNDHRTGPEVSTGRARWCSELLDIKGVQLGVAVVYMRGRSGSIHRSIGTFAGDRSSDSECARIMILDDRYHPFQFSTWWRKKRSNYSKREQGVEGVMRCDYAVLALWP
ncbi:hypothetical protein VNO77_22793 [Canavalia gladiata]|uniref:Uncharacterized protein n=1 Tax=Canavalia gladiata TaxID=3824 RepID=A0AAN9L4P8_CANGL